MSVIVNNAANRIFQEFNTSMMRMIDESEKVWPEFAMEVPSSRRSTLHAWLYNQAKVREWLGSRTLNDMETAVWEVVNRTWELSWKFSEYQLRDDESGLVAQALSMGRSYGAKWVRHEDTLIRDTVQGGTTALCYDGQYFFDVDHPIDLYGITSGTFSNKNTASALTAATYSTALIQMLNFTQPDGSPWVGPGSSIKLIVEPSNWIKANQITNLEWLTQAAVGVVNAAGPSQNIFSKLASMNAKPVLNQWMANEVGTWYLSAEADGMKPIIFQRRQGVETQEQGPGSAIYFDKKEYHIGQDSRYTATYGHPQLMIRNEP